MKRLEERLGRLLTSTDRDDNNYYYSNKYYGWFEQATRNQKK
jgi:hypothetical protein